MTDPALHALALLSATAGMAALALTVPAHWRQVAGPRLLPAPGRLGLRIAGTTLLAGAFAACLSADPPTMAALVWTTLLTIAAGLVTLALAAQARLKTR